MVTSKSRVVPHEFVHYCRSFLEPEVDLEWYAGTYADDLKRFALDGETPLDFYIREGGRIGHDPHPFFSEVDFRRKNLWVRQRMLVASNEFGFLIYISNRANVHPDQFDLCNLRYTEGLRLLTINIDRAYILDQHGSSIEDTAFVPDFYINCAVEGRFLDPAPDFSEEHYQERYPEVASAIESGGFLSGFQHYLMHGHDEGRQVRSVAEFKQLRAGAYEAGERVYLEENFAGITFPQELSTANALSQMMRSLDVRLDARAKRGIRVFVQHFFPEVFFGGYGAFFDFLRRLKSECHLKLTLYVCGTTSLRTHCDNVERVRRSTPEIFHVFDDYVLLSADQSSLTVSPDCEVISYSAETHFLATQVATQTKRLPFFFIQDDEAMFHPSDSVSSFKLSAFEIPHFGMVNSKVLLGHLINSDAYPTIDQTYKCVSFENRISPLQRTEEEFVELQTSKQRRKLIIYGRPEVHASRNQFAFITVALRMAIEKGLFDDRWEFLSIGSLDFEGDVPLANGLSMKQFTRVPKSDYERFISTGDIGISMISTPHPGIIHFQMAAFGLATVTNTGFGRTTASLKAMSDNLVPVRLRFDDLLRGLAEAKEKAADYKGRFAAAKRMTCEMGDSTLNAAVDAVVQTFLSPRRLI